MRFKNGRLMPERQNLLLQDVEYKITETGTGAWKRYMYPDGKLFAEYRSKRQLFGMPLLHYTYGRSPETGRRVVARGVFAVGRLAVGLVAIGQASLGLIAIGQLGIGLLFGLAQLATGALCVGQAAIGYFAVGQIAIGHVAIGQIAIGHMVLAQEGIGTFVIDKETAHPQAVEYFTSLKKLLFP